MAKPVIKFDPGLLQESVVGNVTYRSTCDFHITAEDSEKARIELKETADVRQSALKNLREMLSKDERIRYRMDDEYLIRFLRYRKFDCKQAYKSIHSFYKMRNEEPQLFRMPSDNQLWLLKSPFANIMPYVNEDGVLLFIHKFGHWNPDKTSLLDILNMFSYVSDILTMNPHAQINGVMDIWDFAGTTASHLSALMKPSSLRLWTKYVQNVYPWRIKKAVFFNSHTLVYASSSIIRQFLSKKISDRINMVKVELQFDPSLLKELVVGNKTFRPTCDYNVSERDLEIARKELLESEEKRKTSLKELKTMLTNDRRFRYRMDDDYLLRFLRFMKFDVNKTYGLVQYFYTMRNEYPHLFTMPPDVELKLEGNFINMMPYTQDDGEIVVIYRVGFWNPSAVSVLDLCRMCSYVSDVTSMNPHAQINGLIDIFDLSSATAEQMAILFYPPSLTFWTKFVQDMFPWRVKKVIIMNCNPLLHASISVLRYVLKKEIADRIVLICSLDQLHKHVNPAILPKEYGGNLDDEECYSYMKKVVLSNKKYLGYENSFIGNRK